MVQQIAPETTPQIIYPDSDGQQIADNTKQFRWIVTIKENLEILFATSPDVFIAGDLLWYPVEGDNKIRKAPDILAVLGRPKGDRGCYKQWEENNIPPQVVFEILSPGKTQTETIGKLFFYQNYGVEEYYIYDPDTLEFTGSQRVGDRLEEIPEINGWVSPRLGIRFQMTPETIEIYRPDDRKFLTSVELDRLREQESQRAVSEQQEKQLAQQEKQLAQQQLEEERTLRQQEQQRYQALIELLREKGIDPQQL
ncbi:Uma2 family endonuclease [Microcoleus sp. C2C3]|uniref:Uma2 family endonuclease n=1 Tax=unclassified Microcoleus TaxID=2642155 RepID=UPI002FD0DD2C